MAARQVTYSPESFGARCDLCVLSQTRIAGPVGPEMHKDSVALIVSDYPQKEEVQQGRPLVGKAGQELMTALRGGPGLRRESFSYTHALACQPPDNKYSKVLSKLRVFNKIRAKNKLDPLPTPVECCRMRLFHDMVLSDNVMELGGIAIAAVRGEASIPKIMKLRGAPEERDIDGKHVKLFPTVHPGLVLHQRRYTKAFRTDVQRAIRWFTGVSEWSEPRVVYNPTPQQLEAFLFSGEDRFAWDVETGGRRFPEEAKHPLLARLRCIGFANDSVVMVVGWLSVDGHTRIYTPDDEAKLEQIISKWMIAPNILKVSHNGGSYDRVIVEEWIGVTPYPILDNILVHRSVESELPHALEYVGSVYTPIDRPWKSDKAGIHAKTDAELWAYNSLDCAITYRVSEPLCEAAKLRNQIHIVQQDHKLQEICVGMHRNGMLIDQKKRAEHDERLRNAAIYCRAMCRDVLDDSNFNPGSVNQVKDLLFDKWQLPVYEMTESDEPSTNDDVIRMLALEPGLQEKQTRFLTALRFYRRATSTRGTRIVKMKRMSDGYIEDDDLAFDSEETEEEREYRIRDGGKLGALHDDGCYHASWNVHVPVTGRFSASLVQNWPRVLRDMFIARPGNCFVGVDMDQLELRMSTNMSGAKLYTDCFNAKGDPHTLNALIVYAEEGRPYYERAKAKYGTDKKARKDDPDWSRMCDFSKRFVFAAQYKAGVETIHNTLRAAENDNGELINAKLSVAQVQMFYDTWISQVPEFPRWWQRDLDTYRKQGFLADPVEGRRRDFADGENEQEIANYLCQSGGASIVNRGTIEFVKQVPFNGKYGPGLVAQVHDALLAEVKIEHAEHVMKVMQACLTIKVPNLPVPYTASGKIGFRKDKEGKLLDTASRWNYTE